MPTLNVKQFGFLAWATGLVLVTYLGGSVFELVTHQITFKEFVEAIAVPGLPLIGWAARGAQVGGTQ